MGLIDSVEKMSRSTSSSILYGLYSILYGRIKWTFFGENGVCRFPGQDGGHGARDALNSDRILLELPRPIYDTYDYTTWQSSSLGQ